MIRFLVGVLTGALLMAASAAADIPRWSGVSGLLMWTHASSGTVEVSTSNPLPVVGQ